MSLKINISKDELDTLTNSQIINIFTNNGSYFSKNDYLIERYKREKEINEMIGQDDDTKISSIINFEREIIDKATGYGANKPITYYDKSDENYNIIEKESFNGLKSKFVEMIDKDRKNEYIDILLDIFSNNDTYELDTKTMRECLIKGSYDEIIFKDIDTDEIVIKGIDGDCIAFYDTSLNEKMIGFCRKIKYENPLSKGTFVNSYEFYKEEEQFIFKEGEETRNIIEYGATNLLQIPIIRYDFGESYLENLISPIRSYELVTNNTKKILNYNDDSILLLSNITIATEMEENETEEQYKARQKLEVENYIKDVKTAGTIFADDATDGELGIRWLTKEINDSATENHKKNLKNDIYSIAGTYNSSEDNSVYQNTLSLVFKLYGLETKMGMYCNNIKKGQMKRIKLITDIINFERATTFNYKNINMTFTRDLPTNINEELNMINQMSGHFSLETIYEKSSFIENPKKEIEKYKKWQIELAQLEADKEKIMSDATENQMTPDRINNKVVKEEIIVEE